MAATKFYSTVLPPNPLCYIIEILLGILKTDFAPFAWTIFHTTIPCLFKIFFLTQQGLDKKHVCILCEETEIGMH